MAQSDLFIQLSGDNFLVHERGAQVMRDMVHSWASVANMATTAQVRKQWVYEGDVRMSRKFLRQERHINYYPYHRLVKQQGITEQAFGSSLPTIEFHGRDCRCVWSCSVASRILGEVELDAYVCAILGWLKILGRTGSLKKASLFFM